MDPFAVNQISAEDRNYWPDIPYSAETEDRGYQVSADALEAMHGLPLVVASVTEACPLVHSMAAVPQDPTADSDVIEVPCDGWVVALSPSLQTCFLYPRHMHVDVPEPRLRHSTQALIRSIVGTLKPSSVLILDAVPSTGFGGLFFLSSNPLPHPLALPPRCTLSPVAGSVVRACLGTDGDVPFTAAVVAPSEHLPPTMSHHAWADPSLTSRAAATPYVAQMEGLVGAAGTPRRTVVLAATRRVVRNTLDCAIPAMYL
ncbi:hypothetical protein KIPB_005449 [Kipferlia bialata]|uniref:Uncharacterized protein n=1 Tax=Kipferlia bialata TaxID=797122 RepID=A0A9K3GIJ1_9EUKA|nr:hypothetical protein KIPB_005449 [Kipferlia bialata]|eukprot:g5449.t1